MLGYLIRQFHICQIHAWTFSWSVIFTFVIFSAPLLLFLYYSVITTLSIVYVADVDYDEVV